MVVAKEPPLAILYAMSRPDCFRQFYDVWYGAGCLPDEYGENEMEMIVKIIMDVTSLYQKAVVKGISLSSGTTEEQKEENQ
jgi:hypothetical protein